MITTEVFDSYPSALDALAAKIRGKAFEPTRRTIVLTPDKYTLYVERALFTGGGSLDCEALTLSRLFRRICPKSKTLSREGAVMLMAKAVADVANELVYYKRAASYPDFARSVFDALMQIGSSDASPDAFVSSARGATKQKFTDLALIKSRYDFYKADLNDSCDRLRLLCDAAATSELIVGADIYAIGYGECTALNKRVFESLAMSCASFTVYDAKKPIHAADGVSVFRAADAVSQYKKLAGLIREYLMDGGNAEDVAIVCPDPRVLARILREYEIPFYFDAQTPLDKTPPAAALFNVCRIARGDGDNEKLIELCKNPFSGVDRADAEKLCQYLSGFSYGGINKDPDDEGAARAVKRARELCEYFNCETFTDGLKAVMEKGEFDLIAQKLDGELEARISSSVFEDDGSLTDCITPLRSLIELAEKFGADAHDFEASERCLAAAARAVFVRSVPRFTNRVTVCMPQALRLARVKKLFVTDLNEGVMPRVTQESGLLSDDEIEATGNKIEPTVQKQNASERDELTAVMQNAQSVTCSYCADGKRAVFLSGVCGAIEETDYSDELEALRASDDPEYIKKFAVCKTAAYELSARDFTAYPHELLKASGGGKTAAPFADRAEVKKHSVISSSELTDWFNCPYKRFLKHSVGVSERKAAFDAMDFGTVLHDVMLDFAKEYIDNGVLSDSRERVESSVKNALAKLDIELDERRKEKLVCEACEFVSRNKYAIEAGEFRPVAAEKEFCGDILLGKDKVPFKGVIDRIDKTIDGEQTRVIDYKTNPNKQFSIEKCRNGSDMQLPLYAAQLKKQGENVTGMFFVPLEKKYDYSSPIFRGKMVMDEDVAQSYDYKLSSGEKSDVVGVKFKADGTFNNVMKKPLMEEDEFDELLETCVNTASKAVDEMQGGYIARSPIAGACKYCGYFGLCDGAAERDDRLREGDDDD